MDAAQQPKAISASHLWEVRVPPWNSAIGMMLCATIGAGLFGIALYQGARVPLLGSVVLWAFAFAAFWGAYTFGRWVLSPPLAIAATEAGLVTFFRVDKADYGPPGFVVPWSEIASLSYETYVSRARQRRHALVVHLRAGHAPMPIEVISLQRVQDALYWNVWSAATGKQVVNDLGLFLQRFTSSPRWAGR